MNHFADDKVLLKVDGNPMATDRSLDAKTSNCICGPGNPDCLRMRFLMFNKSASVKMQVVHNYSSGQIEQVSLSTQGTAQAYCGHWPTEISLAKALLSIEASAKVPSWGSNDV